MKNFNFTLAIIYLGFFAIIGIGIYVTQEATPLWALVFFPAVSEAIERNNNKKEEEKKEEERKEE